MVVKIIYIYICILSYETPQLTVYFIANDCLTQRLMLIPGHPYEVWRYFTYTLLHSDLMHLLLNVSLQASKPYQPESSRNDCWMFRLMKKYEMQIFPTVITQLQYFSNNLQKKITSLPKLLIFSILPLIHSALLAFVWRASRVTGKWPWFMLREESLAL